MTTDSPAKKAMCDVFNDAHESFSQIVAYLDDHGLPTTEVGRVSHLLNLLFDSAEGNMRRLAVDEHDATICEWCARYTVLGKQENET